MELAAYVLWKKSFKKDEPRESGEFEAAWDALVLDDKAQWVPDNPRDVLLSEPQWATLLAKCGKEYNPQLVAVDCDESDAVVEHADSCKGMDLTETPLQPLCDLQHAPIDQQEETGHITADEASLASSVKDEPQDSTEAPQA
eukprot:1811644-Amphidinium_carterae.1